MKLALGTVQFGLPYGSRQPSAPVSAQDARAMLQYAWASGVDMLDAAPVYGRAEEVVAAATPPQARFAITTKTVRLAEAGGVAAVAERVRESCRRFGGGRLHAVLVHHGPDLEGPQGEELFQAMTGLKDEGTTARIGVSVYDPETLAGLLDRFPIECVQLPMNILDQRFLETGLLVRLGQRGIEVHVRSVYLQGRLLMEPSRLPASFAAAVPVIERFRQDAHELGLTLPAALMCSLMSCREISRLVVGADTLADLAETVAAFRAAGECARPFDASPYAMSDPGIIDPRRWSQ